MRVEGLEVGVWGLGFGVWGAGFTSALGAAQKRVEVGVSSPYRPGLHLRQRNRFVSAYDVGS